MGKVHEFVVIVPACVSAVKTAGPASMSHAPYMHMLSTSVDSVHTAFEVCYKLLERRCHCWLQTQIILCSH